MRGWFFFTQMKSGGITTRRQPDNYTIRLALSLIIIPKFSPQFRGGDAHNRIDSGIERLPPFEYCHAKNVFLKLIPLAVNRSLHYKSQKMA